VCCSAIPTDEGEYFGDPGDADTDDFAEKPSVIIPPSSLACVGFVSNRAEVSQSYSKKFAKRMVNLRSNRHGVVVPKATLREVITFEELLRKLIYSEELHVPIPDHKSVFTYTQPLFLLILFIDAIKNCKKDPYGRLIGPSDLFWRTPEVELSRCVEYEKDQSKWATTADRLYCEYFGYAASKNEEGKLVSQQTDAKRQTVWIKNKFPYAFEEGIQHDVCFFGSIQARNFCLDVIKNKIGTGKHVVWFTNSMENRSVPEIDHIQIIYRDAPI
jgi:hypothetical protein